MLARPTLARIYANNFRTFVGFEIRPFRTTLLLGENGTGKSSVIDVLTGIRAITNRNAEVSDAFPWSTVTRFGGSNEQRFELDVESEWGVFRYMLRLTHDLDRETSGIASEEVTLDGHPLYQFSNSEVQLFRDDHSAARQTFAFTPRRSFLASLESKPFNQRVTWFKEFLGSVWCLRLNPFAMTALAPKHASTERGLQPDGSNFASVFPDLRLEVPDQLEHAEAALRKVVPGFRRLRMEPSGRSRVLVATFDYPGGEPYDVDFDELSDGQRALVVLYAIVYAFAREPSVLCLDEPDNFVAIREIQPLLVELANANDATGVQTIVISHSSEVIDYLVADAVLLERPDGGQTRIGELAKGSDLRMSELMARGWHAAR